MARTRDPRANLGPAAPELRSSALAIEMAPLPRSARMTIWLIILALASGIYKRYKKLFIVDDDGLRRIEGVLLKFVWHVIDFEVLL